MAGRGRKGRDLRIQGLSEKAVMGAQSGTDAAGTSRKRDKAGKGATDGKRQSAEGLSHELAEIYGALDFYPRSVEEIGQILSEKYPEKQIITCLMQLCMEDLAIQMSPGHFCSKRD